MLRPCPALVHTWTKALPASGGQGPARSLQVVVAHKESQECTWLQALGCHGLGQARKSAEWRQTFSLLDSVGCTNLR